MLPLLDSIYSKTCLITLEYRTQTRKKNNKSLLEITTGGEEKVRKIYKALKAGSVEDARRGGRVSGGSRQALW